MDEMNWIQEYFYNKAMDKGRNEGRSEGIVIGEARGKEQGRSETLSAAINFMRSNGMSNEQINNFRNSILK